MDIKEKRFESDIEEYMLTHGGYTKGNLKTYDREKAIDMPKLVEFIKKTQPKEWQRYERNYGSDAEKKLFKRINESIEMHGMLYVLRHGIEDRGVKLKVASFKPETTNVAFPFSSIGRMYFLPSTVTVTFPLTPSGPTLM